MEEASSENVLQNIKEYAESARKRLGDAMEVDEQASSAVEAHLASTIGELQKRLEQRQKELNQVC